jgi:hypothetical protein
MAARWCHREGARCANIDIGFTGGGNVMAKGKNTRKETKKPKKDKK